MIDSQEKGVYLSLCSGLSKSPVMDSACFGSRDLTGCSGSDALQSGGNELVRAGSIIRRYVPILLKKAENL